MSVFLNRNRITLRPAFRVAAAVAILAAMAISVACGDSETSETSESSVDIALQEWGISPAAIEVPAGKITFNVTNDGPDDPHEFVIIRIGDTAIADIPVVDGMVPEDEVDFVAEVEEIDVGESGTLEIELTVGRYLLLCNIVEEEDDGTESHYELGMRALLTVN